MTTMGVLKFFILSVTVLGCSAQNYTLKPDGSYVTPDSQIYFNVLNLTDIEEKTYVEVFWTTTLPGAHHANFTIVDDFVSDVTDIEASFGRKAGSNITASGSFNVSMKFIGYNNITLNVFDITNQTLESKMLVGSVLIGYPIINTIFLYVLGIMIFIVYINMGATLDLTVVKTIIKKPVGPIVGLCCQYTIMPLIAYGLAKLFFPDDPLLQLGMFLNGASPGGGQSNIWTYLLGGSLDLSVTMTFTSTVVAFGAVPLWVLTLGPTIFDGTPFVIPYLRIAMLIVMLVIPCAIGVAIQFIRPKWSVFMADHVLKPVAIFNMVFITTFGFYANRFVFQIFTWRILLACILMPVCGYLCGLIIAKLARRTKPEIISISIETGVQNANIAIFILKTSLPKPAGDLTIVIPGLVAILTPIPLLMLYGCKRLYMRHTRSSQGAITSPHAAIKQGQVNAGLDSTSENGLEKFENQQNSHYTNGTITDTRYRNGISNPDMSINEDKV